MGEVAVRPAATRDLPALLELLGELDRLQRGWRVFRPRPNIREEMEALYRHSLQDPQSLLLVATEDDQVIGMALARAHTPSSFSGERAVEMSSVVVKPSHRGRGAGAALAAEAARFAGRLRLERVTIKTFAQNTGALRFWRRLGFEPRMVQMTARAADLIRSSPPVAAEGSRAESSGGVPGS